MEMRKEECFKQVSRGGQVMTEEFDKLKKFILETNGGVIVIDDKLNKKRLKRKEIFNLFYLINESNLKEVKYIPTEINMFSIAEIKVTTTNNESFMIELDNHRTLY